MSTLEWLSRDSGLNPTYAVIWMHGLGADGHDFEPIVPELCDRQWPSIRFIFPHAPVRPVTISGGTRMRAWYDIRSLDRTALGEAPGLRDSIQAIGELIELLITQGFASERIFIAGFSQGGAVALCTALRYPKTLGGIIALSTYLPLAEKLPSELNAANAKVPIFMAHGLYDPVVVMDLGLLSAKQLRDLGIAVDWFQYPMPHSVCNEEILALRTWLGPKLSA